MDLAITQSMIKPNGNGLYAYQNEKTRNVNNKNNKKTITPIDEKNEKELLLSLEDDLVQRQKAIINLIKAANEKLSLYVNNENVKKPDPVVVQLYVVFLRVGEIDNVKERFQADAYFEACWEDNTIDPKSTFDPRHHWEPELFIENAVGNLKQDIKYRIEEKDGKTIIHEMRMIKGVFWEKLELWDFPLDVQDLTITITSARDQKEIKFEQSTCNESLINTEDFQQQQEWNLYSHININKKYIFDVWSKHERPCFSVSSNIARRPGYYIYNAYMLMFLISVLGFVPFSFPATAPHFRIQTTCLLILSSANFRWIVTQKLPTISYLTTLDKYAIGALVFLVLLCIWHAIIGSSNDLFHFATLKNPSFRNELDEIVLCVIAGLYLTFHLIYIMFFLFKFSRYSKLEIAEPEKEKPVPKVQEPEPEPENEIHFSIQPLDINSDAYFEKQKSIIESRRSIATLTALSANHIKPSVRTSSVNPSDNIFSSHSKTYSTNENGRSNSSRSRKSSMHIQHDIQKVNNPFMQSNKNNQRR